jgi:hypothetical protein
VTLPTDAVTFYRDEKNNLILFEINGRIVARMTMSEWSKAIANPKIPGGPYNFGRGVA